MKTKVVLCYLFTSVNDFESFLYEHKSHSNKSHHTLSSL